MIATPWEKFQRATITLARSGPIKDRLTDAYRNHLARIACDDLPKELRGEFQALCSELTRERPLLPAEDSFKATIRKMSTEQAERLACSVVKMFCALPRSVTPAGGLKTPAQVVPLRVAEA